jgi:hypothetical protein
MKAPARQTARWFLGGRIRSKKERKGEVGQTARTVAQGRDIFGCYSIMSQSHVAAGRYVTGQKFSGGQVGSGPERALGGLPSWGNRSGGS